MSGLCGIVQFDDAPAVPEQLESMLSAAAHRARDGIGRWIERTIALGYLATEVGPAETRTAQPLVDEEAGLVLIAHARLDNREELQHVLEQAGLVQSKKPSDAALILAAYKQWGSECPEHIAGDFAFALWDVREQHLFAARDPMAMRPLYYHRAKGRLLFASEVRQLLAVDGVSKSIREVAIANHLAGRFHDLTGTYFEEIHQLPPAHALLADADSTRIWKYWEPDPTRRIRYNSEEEYAEHLLELLLEAARVRFQSPHPAGLLLSGGLDSGAVAAAGGSLKEQRRMGCPNLYTYSWAFHTLSQCDERFISDEIVNHYDLPATYVDAEANGPLRTYPEHLPFQDDPFMGVYDSIVERTLEQARKDGVGYVFTGHRGDQLVGDWIFNYLDLFRSGRWLRLWKDLKAHHERLGLPVQHTWRRYFWHPLRSSLWPHDRLPRLRSAVQGLVRTIRPEEDDGSPFPPWMSPTLRTLIPRYPSAEPPPKELDSNARRERYASIFMPVHMHVAAANERLCAKYQLVASDIWTDRRLIEFALAVPAGVLCRAGENKRLLRQALGAIMPEAVRQKVRKINPEPLYRHALKTEGASIAALLFTSAQSVTLGYVDADAFREHYEAFLSGDGYDQRLWHALTLEMWLRHHHVK